MKKGKDIKRIMLFIVIILFIAIIFLSNYKVINDRIQRIINKNEESALTADDFVIKDYENNGVNLIFSRTNGISKIETPSDTEIICNNRNKVSIDFSVEENKEYTFKITDSIGQET